MSLSQLIIVFSYALDNIGLFQEFLRIYATFLADRLNYLQIQYKSFFVITTLIPRKESLELSGQNV